MTIGFRYTAVSDIGLLRKSNQDGGYASPHMLVLADGMGGAAAGDVASSVTIAHLAQIDDVHPADDLLPRLRYALHQAHRELFELSQANPELEGMGTTCIAILRANNKLAMVHIGDSRAYVLRNGRLTQVTHDHTLVQYLVDQGKLTPEEADVHPKRNVIMRALSDTPDPIELDESIREAVPGDRWLLCSDGLFGVVSKETIEETLVSVDDLDECAEQLIDLALAGGAPDNVTVVVADIVDFSIDNTAQQADRGPIVVGSAAVDHARPSRQGSSAAGLAASLIQGNRDAASNLTQSYADDSPQCTALNGDAAIPGISTDDSTLTDRENRQRWRGHSRNTARAHHEPYNDDNQNNSRARRRLLPKILVSFGIVCVLIAAGWGGYTWTQTRYYVGDDHGTVTIFRGIPQQIGPLKLYSVYATTDLETSRLTVLDQMNVEKNILTSDLPEAKRIVEDLEKRAVPDELASEDDESTKAPQDQSHDETEQEVQVV